MKVHIKEYTIRMDSKYKTLLDEYNWNVVSINGRHYAVAHKKIVEHNSRHVLYLHREIARLHFGLTDEDMQSKVVELIDEDEFNYHANNLRVTSRAEFFTKVTHRDKPRYYKDKVLPQGIYAREKANNVIAFQAYYYDKSSRMQKCIGTYTTIKEAQHAQKRYTKKHSAK